MTIKISKPDHALFRVLLKRDIRRKGIIGIPKNTPTDTLVKLWKKTKK